MKQTIQVRKQREVLSLLTGIGFATVPDWYDAACRTLRMDLIVPKHRTPGNRRPCLLFFCGGAFATVNRSVWMPEMMYFAERGCVVATAEYRTSNQAIFPAALIDAKSAVRFLKAHAEQFSIDPNGIVVAGESAGGTISSLLGVTGGIAGFDQGEWLSEDSRVCAAIDYYGVTDMLAARRAMANMGDSVRAATNNGTVNSWMLDAFLGPGFSDAEALRASATAYVDANTPPIMILHGTADSLNDIRAQSDAFYERLVAAGREAEYYRLEGIEHGDDAFYQPEIKELVLRFIREHVPSGVSSGK